jgi:hypothetical protein
VCEEKRGLNKTVAVTVGDVSGFSMCIFLAYVYIHKIERRLFISGLGKIVKPEEWATSGTARGD